MKRMIPVLVVALAFVGCDKDAETSNPDEAASTDDDFAQGAPEEGTGEDTMEEPAEEEAVVLTQSSFEQGINDHMQDVADCYADAQSKNAKLEGTMNARFTISADGKVESVEALDGSTLKDDGMTACIQEKAQAWQFDPTPSGESMPMEFPFTLAPG
jgi:TonB family protein